MIRLAYGPSGEMDIARADGNLVLDESLDTAVSISLFTDRRALPSDNAAVAGGWWGDAYPVAEGDLIGSRLWLLRRARDLPATLRLAEDYAKESLAWLVDTGVAIEVKATATKVADGKLGLDISVVRGDGQRWQRFWEVNTDAV